MAMTIGELAEAAGVNAATVRYYERRGILPSPPRTPAGYRQYDLPTVDRIRFIRRAQDLGFTLEEIDDLLALRVDRLDTCGDVESKTRTKLAEVEAKIIELERLKDVLSELVKSCARRERTDDCPILAVLRDEEGSGRP